MSTMYMHRKTASIPRLCRFYITFLNRPGCRCLCLLQRGSSPPHPVPRVQKHYSSSCRAVYKYPNRSSSCYFSLLGGGGSRRGGKRKVGAGGRGGGILRAPKSARRCGARGLVSPCAHPTAPLPQPPLSHGEIWGRNAPARSWARRITIFSPH